MTGNSTARKLTHAAGAPVSDNVNIQTAGPRGPALKAYFGDDPSRYAERSSMSGLQRTPLPPMVATAELDPVAVERQALQLHDALCEAKRCPASVRFAQQNHFSEVLSINSLDDAVGTAILAFIRGVR